ncbi:ubiquitin carboxyl-terminal hydrolase 32-like isoform X2 [Daphnia pulex]|uniref:ubiquitin carboxyl-terminal hydrolase 32-like isoform X2 n=1 Tax=Daphnia pulex TaxID=6669 RepID=UPI001EDFB6E8|nr:ubiquitin carboxyl-terminal hydrolase 32-like isoform X2 [Daphnia pulex]
MGAKDSKPQVLSYEEAVKRVNTVELKRLKDTFSKYATPSGLLQQSIFFSEILGDTVPNNLAELIYTAWCGTTKGITFKDLLSGLVLLTRGHQDEKCRFIFSLYAKDMNSVVTKDDVINYTTKYSDGWNLENISNLFDEAEAVNYSKFREWLITYPCATSLTEWLLSDPCPITLSNDLETPTFYQTLSGVTHLDEQEIIDLEKKYWQLKNLSSNGKFDIELFLSFASAPISSVIEDDNSKFSIARGLFSAFDENCDGHLDFKEIVCGISAACRGPLVERIKFCFKIFDFDRDGVFCRSEVTQLIESLKQLAVDQFPEDESDCDSLEVSDIIKNEMESVDLETFLMWAVNRSSLKHLLDMLHQLCHVVLGLRPASRIEEGKLIQNWLRREVKRGYRVGEFWYLVSSIWWKQWSDYVTNQDESIKSVPSSASLKNNSSDSGSDLNTVVRPRAIDNTCLVATSTIKATVLTGEGGRLRRDVEKGKDYEVVPEAIWKALSSWYGGSPALPRQAVQLTDADPIELELYPLLLRLLRHSTTANDNGPAWNGQSWNSIVGGYGAAALGGYGYFPSATQQTPRRYLAYVAAFSQLATVSQTYEYLCGRLRLKFDDVRLWLMKDDHCLVLLEDENATLASLSCRDNDQLLIEVRNKDLTWPEEMVSLSGQSGDKYRQALPSEKGATGLNNLGNTCFMNASLQCVSNTQALTQYFTSSMHLLELNRDNPLGMKGNIAKDYGDLIRDIWKGRSRTIAPLRLRWTIGKYAPRFNGYQQHDAQELLAFLLDGLHEDLNRVHDKPYVELSDSEGRPDIVVAQEAWENHLLRNRSIVVELFHGQLKSKVTCGVCQRESVRFDPFNYLSLPLPLESYVHVEVVVVRLDGSVPVKYGLRLPMDATYLLLKERLAALCQVSYDHLLLAEVSGAMIKSFPGVSNKVRPTSGFALFAYQVLNSSEVIHLLPTNGGHIGLVDGEEGAKDQSSPNNNKLADHSNNQAAKVFHIKEGGNTNTSSEVRRPVGICMNVMSTVFCRKNGSSTVGQESLPPRSPADRPTTNGGTNEDRNGGDRSSLASTSSGSGGLGSPVSLTSNNSSAQELNGALGMGASFLVVYHRKMIRQDLYFVSPHKTRPSLFGLPLLVPLAWTTDGVSSHPGDESSKVLLLQTTSQDLYRCVWTLVSRLVSPSPPTDSGTLPNHAHDCDDSLGYEFPFTLKVVQANGIHCGLCPWTKFCKGCPLPPTPDPLPNGSETNSPAVEGVLNYCIAVDWEPTALHLRYQTSLEKVFDEDPSVAKAVHQQTEPVSLEQCLQAFTREEQLSGDEKYYCPKCATHQPATKKLQIWRLPPILIVHLKRFQFVNHRWIKSHKAVQFPHNNLDFTEFLAAIPSETLVRHRQKVASSTPPNGIVDSANDESNGDDMNPKLSTSSTSYSNGHPPNLSEVINGNESTRKRLESTSLMTHPVHDEDLIDFHQHRLLPGYNKLDITYSLYAAVCHSGIMGGGHYISYAKNPNGKWFYYNDSTCKESSANQIEGQTAYMLFFERDGIDMKAYLPKLREPSTSSAESANSDSTAGKGTPAVIGLEEEDGKKCCIM